MSLLLNISSKGVVYSVNNIGPYTEPCGTPQSKFTGFELGKYLIATHCV